MVAKLRTKNYLIIIACFFLSTFAHDSANSPYDLTIIGPVRWADGLGRISIGLAEILGSELRINYLPISKSLERADVPSTVLGLFDNEDRTPGNVAFFTHQLWTRTNNYSNAVPEQCFIKIAYSMLESTAIPPQWVAILNEKFDLVVVPDEYLKKVYSESGVQIPIFVLPHGIYLQQYLSSTKKEKNSPFTFGLTATIDQRKNQALLLEAFLLEFKNNPNAKLSMHGRWGNNDYIDYLRKKIEKEGAKNVELIVSKYTDKQCFDFMCSLDCYALLSKGEGLSVTPREALALGIPCILSNNTAHKTICSTGYVYTVPSMILDKANYGRMFEDADCGYCFNCDLNDARRALRAVYDNYDYYQSKALDAREWVQSYQWFALKDKFRNLIKPYKVVLGDSDNVTNTHIMTNSPKLYEKYCKLIGQMV